MWKPNAKSDSLSDAGSPSSGSRQPNSAIGPGTGTPWDLLKLRSSTESTPVEKPYSVGSTPGTPAIREQASSMSRV